MSNIYNGNIKITIFGESHGPYVGVVIDGLKPGIKVDQENLRNELLRRKPKYEYTTSRVEDDDFQIISGLFEGYTTSSALTIIIPNKDCQSSDYQKGLVRPGHADYTNSIHALGFNDYRGGGASSGRLMVPIVVAGAICKQILASKGITISSHLLEIGGVCDDKIAYTMEDAQLFKLQETKSLDKYTKMLDACKRAKENKDSVGGIIEVFALGVEAGIGEPMFDSVEGKMANLFFAIPGAKAVEFGIGKEIARMYGSIANDAFFIKDNQILTKTNNNGGINGGFTNGMPIVAKVSFKPTSSIGQIQETIDLEKHQASKIEIKGRNDVCFALRSRVIVEGMVAIALLDLFTSRYGYMG